WTQRRCGHRVRGGAVGDGRGRPRAAGAAQYSHRRIRRGRVWSTGRALSNEPSAQRAPPVGVSSRANSDCPTLGFGAAAARGRAHCNFAAPVGGRQLGVWSARDWAAHRPGRRAAGAVCGAKGCSFADTLCASTQDHAAHGRECGAASASTSGCHAGSAGSIRSSDPAIRCFTPTGRTSPGCPSGAGSRFDRADAPGIRCGGGHFGDAAPHFRCAHGDPERRASPRARRSHGGVARTNAHGARGRRRRMAIARHHARRWRRALRRAHHPRAVPDSSYSVHPPSRRE
ncbi:MAG: hypothetical protein RL385_4055, partial [Pseudomonadota bacterium]